MQFPLDHTAVATVKTNDGIPQEDVGVTFTVVSGTNAGQTVTITTVADGTASWTYSDMGFVAGIEGSCDFYRIDCECLLLNKLDYI